MNFVDKMHTFIYKILMRNNREIEARTQNIANANDPQMVQDAAAVRRLADQNEIWTMIAKQLADKEAKQLEAIWNDRG